MSQDPLETAWVPGRGFPAGLHAGIDDDGEADTAPFSLSEAPKASEKRKAMPTTATTTASDSNARMVSKDDAVRAEPALVQDRQTPGDKSCLQSLLLSASSSRERKEGTEKSSTCTTADKSSSTPAATATAGISLSARITTKTHDGRSGGDFDFGSSVLSSPLSELVRGAALREDADAPFCIFPRIFCGGRCLGR